MNTFLANLIWLLHIAFIIFYAVTPFTDIHRFPELHILLLFTGPCLFVHWLANSDECALTHLEMLFRGGEKTESFFYNLVQPVYQPTDDRQVRSFIWAASIALWLITLVKFIKNPCVFKDFFRKALGKQTDSNPVAVGVITTSSSLDDGKVQASTRRLVARYIQEPSRVSMIT